MLSRKRLQVLTFAAAVVLVAGAAPARADYLDTIGLRILRNGGYLRANGEDIEIAQVESASGSGYVPDPRIAAFRGKVFEYEGVGGSISSHATRIGSLIYGNYSGIVPEVEDICVYSDVSFVGTAHEPGLLNPWRGKKPGKLGFDVVNNSWAGSFNNTSMDANALRRMDYAIWRDDVVVVNSTYNESWRPSLPPLMASSYNGITVGKTSGSRGGPATFEGYGRAKPDLVAPMDTTSDATAVVSGAAALLLSEADARKMKPDALAVKAMLMAGAHRPGDWRRGDGSSASKSPLSYRYGAGELRIDRAFHVMAAGEQKENRSAAARGWSSDKLSGNGKDDYYELKYSTTTPEFTAVLTWNRRFSKRGSSFDNLSPVLADLELELLRKVGKKWTPYVSSDSAVDNVEMIAINNLPAGQYRLTVGGARNETYGLAWDVETYAGSTGRLRAPSSAAVSVPEPAAFAWSLPALALLAAGRRRT